MLFFVSAFIIHIIASKRPNSNKRLHHLLFFVNIFMINRCFTKNFLIVGITHNLSTDLSFSKMPGHKKSAPTLQRVPILLPYHALRFWCRFSGNPLLRAPKIKDSCGFWAVLSTCRPYRPCHQRVQREPGAPADLRPDSRWSGPSQRQKQRSPERNE